MSAIRVKLVRGLSGHPEDHRQTVLGLGLKKMGRERIVPDNAATRGMIAKVAYLLEWQKVEGEAPKSKRAKKAAK